MFTLVFWRAALEQAISWGAACVLVFLGVGTIAGADGNTAVNAFMLDWMVLGGVFLGGAFVSILSALAAHRFKGNGPTFSDAQVLNPSQVKKETGVMPAPPDYAVEDPHDDSRD